MCERDRVLNPPKKKKDRKSLVYIQGYRVKRGYADGKKSFVPIHNFLTPQDDQKSFERKRNDE